MRKISDKFFLIFVKIFLIYIFLEFFLLSLNSNQIYTNFVKFFGDFFMLLFLFFTFLKIKRLTFFPEQHIKIVLSIIAVAFVSLVINDLPFSYLLMGIRSLLRYYIVFILSFYYNITEKTLKNISNFFINSFYFEFIIFLYYYIALNSYHVLNHHHLTLGIYLNILLALLLSQREPSHKNRIIITLVFINGFLSTSRIAMMGFLVQIVIYYFFLNKQKLLKKIGTIAVIVFLLFMFFTIPNINKFVTNSKTFDKFKNLNTEINPESNFRMFLISTFFMQSITNTNLLGDGPNTFGSLYTRTKNPEYYYQYGFSDRMIGFAADSDYVNLLMQYGFIGLFMYIYFITSLYKKCPINDKKLLVLLFSFYFLGAWAMPIFTMRISSFTLFAFLGIMYNIDKTSLRSKK